MNTKRETLLLIGLFTGFFLTGMQTAVVLYAHV